MSAVGGSGGTRRAAATLMFAFAFGLLISGNEIEAAAQVFPQGVPGVGAVVLEGEIEVLYEDHDDVARLLHFLHAANRRIPLKFEAGSVPDLITGSRVRVRGSLADGAVTAVSVEVLATASTWTIGPKNVLVILFNFANNPSQPWAMSTVGSVNNRVRDFYLENTFGQTVLSFSVAGWFTIPATDAGCDYYTWASQAESAAISAGFNVRAYDRVVFAFPRASSCNWNGMGNVGGPRSWANGSYTLKTIAHEEGHNFGSHHSKAFKCSPSCATVEYGDDRDVLGKSGIVGHLNAFQKERLGWLNNGTSPTVRTVTASGDYWIDTYETIAGATKALKIWNPAKSGYYYLESREKIGFDANVAAGVTLHLAVSGVSYQLDLDPTTTYDSTLDVGQVFTDDAIGVSVQTISTSIDGAMIRVNMGTAACVTAAPSVSLAAAGPTTFTVTARNNNSPTCPASPFVLNAGTPEGWTATFSPGSSGTVAPGASGSVTLTLTAPLDVSGTYPFSVTVVDTGSDGKSATANGSVTISPRSRVDVAVSASPESGKGNNRWIAIVVTATAGGAPVAGAAITVVITDPNGVNTTLNATAGVDGTGSGNYPLKPKDPAGLYRVTATASVDGVTGAASTTVLIP